MAEQVNANLEKAFFTHILQNPTQFPLVETYFFKNESIQYIYEIIRNEYLISKNKYVPTPIQIATMIRANDPLKEKITDDILKFILKGDNDQYNDDFIGSRFSAWKLSNTLKTKVQNTVDQIRNIPELDFETISTLISKIKSMYGDLSAVDELDEDLGSDFDDPESHKQELSVNKIPTGWSSLDAITGGGWDLSTLVTILGETNIGKCSSHDTLITIRKKSTGEVRKIKIGDFYEEMTKS